MSLEKFIATAWCTPLDHEQPFAKETLVGLNVLLWGPPGSRKTKLIQRISKEMNLFCHTVPSSTVPPEDVGGVFIQDGQGGVKKDTWESEIKTLCEVGEGILFFDEFSTAKQSIQSSLLTAVQERRYGGRTMPPKVRIIAAANPTDTTDGTFALSAASANRWCHRKVDIVPPSQWSEYMLGRYTPDLENLADSEHTVKERWDSVWPTTVSQVTAFVNSKKGSLYSEPALGDAQRGKAWPSLRTWQWATLGIATCRALRSGDSVEQDIIDGLVGNGVGKEFRTWLKAADLPSPEEMLAKGWPPDTARLDRSMAAYESLSQHIATIKDEKKRFKAAVAGWGMLTQACGTNALADIIYGPARTLINAGLGPSCKNADVTVACDPVMQRFYTLRELAEKAARARDA